jgi:hypothetical protein
LALKKRKKNEKICGFGEEGKCGKVQKRGKYVDKELSIV